MGRGRAKAKQQKVARELKYNSQSTDLDALQRELGGSSNGTFVHDGGGSTESADADDEYEDDRWTGTSH
jgi:hypothetical protein